MIKHRLWPFALLSIAVVAMVVLSAGLARLELLPGQLYSLGSRLPTRPDELELPPVGPVPMTLFRAFLA